MALRVSKAPLAVTRIVHITGGELGRPDFLRFPVNPNVKLAPHAALRLLYLQAFHSLRHRP